MKIYSERLAEIARTWKLPEGRGQEIHPIPRYVPTDEMVQVDPKAKQYPLEAFGYHGPGRTHSTYHNVPWLREAHPDVVLMNPVDAQPRGLKTGMLVRVFNDRGALVLPVKVTPRIIPSSVAFPQGAWYRPDEKGLDGAGASTCSPSSSPRRSRRPIPRTRTSSKLKSSGADSRTLKRHEDSIRLSFRQLALHGLQDLRDRMQGQERHSGSEARLQDRP